MTYIISGYDVDHNRIIGLGLLLKNISLKSIVSMKFLGSLLTLMLPTALLAHPGHGVFEGVSLAHYLASPMHLAAILTGTIILVLSCRQVTLFVKRQRQK